MENRITLQSAIVKNSLQDGIVKIKMATVGVQNLNGLTIKDADTIKYDNHSYPLFFEHQRDMNNLIGTFVPKGVDGDDIVAEAHITSPKALDLVKSGALHSASITYVINSYDYDEENDNIIVTDAYLVELSLVLDPADPTAQILNSKTKAQIINNTKEENAVTDEQVKTITDAIEASKREVLDAIKALAPTTSDDSDTGIDDDVTAENARKAKKLEELKGKWV